MGVRIKTEARRGHHVTTVRGLELLAVDPEVRGGGMCRAQHGLGMICGSSERDPLLDYSHS